MTATYQATTLHSVPSSSHQDFRTLLQASTLAAYHSYSLSALDGSIGISVVGWHPWPAEIATPEGSPYKVSSMIKRSACSSAGGSSMIGVPGNGVLLLDTDLQ
jgi:hypothetical protein